MTIELRCGGWCDAFAMIDVDFLSVKYYSSSTDYNTHSTSEQPLLWP